MEADAGVESTPHLERVHISNYMSMKGEPVNIH